MGWTLSGRTQIAFQFPWQLMLISAAAVMVICVRAAVLSIRKVIKLEPAIVFRS
jgi:putative ABC transport system permease protein